VSSAQKRTKLQRAQRECELAKFDANFQRAYAEQVNAMVNKLLKEERTELTKLQKAFRELLKGCNQCDWDEAEGGLLNHCPACCHKVTTLAWETFMEGK